MKVEIKKDRRLARARRTHAKVRNYECPRLVVFRSNKTIYAQIVDDLANKVLCGTSGLKSKKTGVAMAAEVGAEIAKLAKSKKVKKIAFDRNGYKFHGQVKSLAEAARTAGLEF
jgi:large subunit ribosomal protein L18